MEQGPMNFSPTFSQQTTDDLEPSFHFNLAIKVSKQDDN